MSVLVLAPRAIAVVTSSFVNGALAVASDDEADRIVIRCNDNGEVRVNGRRPDTGNVLCADVTSMDITGTGGRDRIDLDQVGPVEFTALSTVSIDGGTEKDTIEGSQFADTIFGGANNDLIRVDSAFADVVDGGDGNDHVEATVFGHVSISDATWTSIELVSIHGSEGDDEIDARDFSSTLHAFVREGDDKIYGGSGRNELSGGPGKDTLIGGIEQDVLRDGSGADEANGKGGNDTLKDGDGVDVLEGGIGNDRFVSVKASDNQFRGGQGSDLLYVPSQEPVRLTDDSIRAGRERARLTSIERALLHLNPDVSGTLDARGFSGRTILSGGVGDDVLLGGSGHDEITGGSGDDMLKGGAGRDFLDGFDGTDTCDGGPGRDRVINCEVT